MKPFRAISVPRGAKEPETMSSIMNTRQAAEFLGVSQGMVVKLRNQGKIRDLKMGRLTRFRRESLEEYLKQCERARPNKEAIPDFVI